MITGCVNGGAIRKRLAVNSIAKLSVYPDLCFAALAGDRVRGPGQSHEVCRNHQESRESAEGYAVLFLHSKRLTLSHLQRLNASIFILVLLVVVFILVVIFI